MLNCDVIPTHCYIYCKIFLIAQPIRLANQMNCVFCRWQRHSKCLWKRLPVLFHNDSHTHKRTHMKRPGEWNEKGLSWHRLDRGALSALKFLTVQLLVLDRLTGYCCRCLWKIFFSFTILMRQQDVIYSTEYLNRFFLPLGFERRTMKKEEKKINGEISALPISVLYLLNDYLVKAGRSTWNPLKFRRS